jgi:hypothetical protein
LTSSLIERQPVPMCNVTFNVSKRGQKKNPYHFLKPPQTLAFPFFLFVCGSSNQNVFQSKQKEKQPPEISVNFVILNEYGRL